jgi:hypothetical protein
MREDTVDTQPASNFQTALVGTREHGLTARRGIRWRRPLGLG